MREVAVFLNENNLAVYAVASRYVFAFVLGAVGTQHAVAQLTPDQEYAKFIDKARAISPMTDFGDQISPRDGAVTVHATDVELRGIGPTIRVTRTYNPKFDSQYTRETSGTAFGAWELEVPRIKTITANALGVKTTSPTGWQVSGDTAAVRNLRCTNFSGPGRIAFQTDSARGWNPWDWWDGYYVVDDGGQQQPLMTRANTSVNPTYRLMTSGNWLVSCLNSTTSGQPGEAFYAVAPDGTKYWFNYLVYTHAETLSKPLWSNSQRAGVAKTLHGDGAEPSIDSPAEERAGMTPNIVGDADYLERRYASMLVTRVEDRFGNYLTYNYNGTGRLSSIDASDGRHVGVGYDGSNRISTITAGTGATARTWTYTYNGTSDGFAAMVVTRPDQSTWQYYLPVLASNGLNVVGDTGSCTPSPNDYEQLTDGTITSPAGATLTLRFNRKRFARSFVYKECWGMNPEFPGYAVNPREWYAWALERKTVTGPGLPSMAWQYSYSAPAPSWYQDCPTPTSCSSTAWTDTLDPEGIRRRSTFSTKFDETEGKLLREEVFSLTGQLVRATDHAYATVALGAPNAYPWPLSVGNDMRKRVNTQTQGRWTPERTTVINLDGATFTRNVNSFDFYARPIIVTRSSSLGQSLTEATSYADFPSLWTLGQIDQVTSNGLAAVDNDYDNSNGTLLNVKKFGVQQASYTYYTNGTLKTQADGAGNTTTYSNWYRGMPQNVAYPTGSSESAVVDQHGWVSSWTNAASYTTSYAYDGMGRLASSTTPAGWTGTTIAFSPIAIDEYGIGPGHWRQTVSKGNARIITYFDGYWRPVMSRSFDVATEASTRKVLSKNMTRAAIKPLKVTRRAMCLLIATRPLVFAQAMTL
jgi:YD repeat-containing protein